jgi:hypothetical protein
MMSYSRNLSTDLDIYVFITITGSVGGKLLAYDGIIYTLVSASALS